MKKLLGILVLILIFSLQSLSKADDISDFEIEGISIGESLLDYITKKEIMSEIKVASFIGTDKKFQRVWKFDGSYELYEYLAFIVKPSDPKYLIHGISGMFDIDDPNKCLKKKNKIVKELLSIFPNSEKFEWTKKSKYDKTGKSKVIGVNFYLDNGSVDVTCYDFADHMKNPSGLDVSITNQEFDNWFKSQ